MVLEDEKRKKMMIFKTKLSRKQVFSKDPKTCKESDLLILYLKNNNNLSVFILVLKSIQNRLTKGFFKGRDEGSTTKHISWY